MPISRLSTSILLRPEDVPASRSDFEVVGAFNPGVALIKDEVILLVRVAERPKEKRSGLTALPRWEPKVGLIIDWVPNSELISVDPRAVRQKADGLIRLTFTSYLRVIRCCSGKQVQEITNSTICPETEVEEFGVEDPRITYLDGRYYITYVAVSRHGPATALASTTDFVAFERHGIIFCAENKDVVLFPERINGSFVAIHRPVCGSPFTRPEMWLAKSEDLLHWGEHTPLSISGSDWQSGRVGAGPAPIRIPQGWLLIYHGNRSSTQPGEVGEYVAGAILLDSSDPTIVLRQSDEPFFRPESDFELNGFVPKVVFPTGLIEDGDRLLLYYGAADTCTAVAEFDRKELLKTLDITSP
jgi:beta-1,2-mannobiose phosphorylase / 1,2-beta-oligomannan phosphorylase